MTLEIAGEATMKPGGHSVLVHVAPGDCRLQEGTSQSGFSISVEKSTHVGGIASRVTMRPLEREDMSASNVVQVRASRDADAGAEDDHAAVASRL